MCIYIYKYIHTHSIPFIHWRNRGSRSNQWGSKCQLLTFTTTGKDTIECVDLLLTTKAVHTRPRTVDTDHNENTTVPSGVVQQDHHSTQWPHSNEQKQLLGSQYSWRSTVEFWLASKCHFPPLCSTQTTLL